MDDEKAVGMTTDAKPLPLNKHELARIWIQISRQSPQSLERQLFATVEARDATIAQQAEQMATMREALETISEGRDAGRHDGKPEEYPAHDADTMFALARAALNQRGDNE